MELIRFVEVEAVEEKLVITTGAGCGDGDGDGERGRPVGRREARRGGRAGGGVLVSWWRLVGLNLSE